MAGSAEVGFAMTTNQIDTPCDYCQGDGKLWFDKTSTCPRCNGTGRMPQSNQVDAVDELLQQMLVDYTAWVNGEPIAWNVKKAEARAKLNALLVAAERRGYEKGKQVYRIAELEKQREAQT